MNVKKYLDQISNLNVLIIGETITDTFIPVRYQGNSMKSFCSVFKVILQLIRSVYTNF